MTAGAIRTPDQRIRVFVSSTLRELADERVAVRRAIERLRMAPVMFELGARPHPPRDLYRAYLEQSDVFVGIYAASYGWVAPDEEISGLEDEYRLAPRDMPRLMYLKSGVDREARLDELIARIQLDDTASYKAYATPEELEDLVLADLATLMAERFDAVTVPLRDAPPPPAVQVPAAFTPIIGREDAIAEVRAMLAEPGTRLVTLLGPGGIGKSRLAIAVAGEVEDLYPDGTVFVPLENVVEPALLLPTIGYALGVRDTGELPLDERLRIALAGRRMLVILDNFEQLVDAADVVVRLYTIAPETSFLVTSRTMLRIRGERVFEVPALATVDAASPDSVSRALDSAAVTLFVTRARAVRPDFEVTDANASDVVAICRSLEGIPLSIELTAARLRVLGTSEILRRLDHQLPLLVAAARDLPERQRTLRSTIEWSFGLLDETERRALRDLAVFAPGFTYASIEDYGARRAWDADALDVVERLVDSSLLRQTESDGDIVFSMLVTVREFCVELLQAEGQERDARDAHAALFAALACAEGVRGFTPRVAALARLNIERGNLRAAVRHLVSVGDLDTAADMAWRLFLYWWVGGYLAEVALWMEELLASPDATMSSRSRAIAVFYVSWRDLWVAPSHELAAGLLAAASGFTEEDDALGVAMLTATAGLAEIVTADPDIATATAWLREGATRFSSLGAGWGESLSQVALGRIDLLRDEPAAATERFRRAVAASEEGGDAFTATIATHHLARVLLSVGEQAEANALFAGAIDGSLRLRHDEGVAYGIEGISAIASANGDLESAGVLVGAADAIRRRVAVFDVPAFIFHDRYLDEAIGVAGAGAAERAAAALARGRDMGSHEAALFALDASARLAPLLSRAP
ncbi:BTAD domain-containing putative transcriptional regulator [Microbacterium aoyamense]|uniref:BTAD domain-containing putative transcriptional regulator n=1 Tax=Microbacterium aoyamense TaxID=344166 RepID=A0ABN2PQZ2_9MICO|nr:DUF4062 domain-containing protein [Microbacterium aoyamense]